MTIARGERGGFPYARYEAFRDQASGFDGITTSFPVESDLEVDGRSAFIASEVSAPNYADVLGLRLELGRWFRSDSIFEAVISDAVWRRSFASSPDVLGRVLLSQTQSYTVVGVAPEDFTGLFAPLRTDCGCRCGRGRRSVRGSTARALPFIFLGRLRPIVSPARAVRLNALDARLPAPVDADAGALARVTVTPVRGTPNAGYRRCRPAFSASCRRS